jgi:hypothetical protein
VLGVGDGITDDTLEEGLEDTTGLFVDHCKADTLEIVHEAICKRVRGKHTGRDTLDTTTTRETADSGLSDTLDVVTENLSVTLGATLSETLSTFSTCRENKFSKWTR